MTRHDPVVFGRDQNLLGIVTVADGPRRRRGVVICAPLAHPNINAYRPLEVLSRRIASGGFPVIRFDWPATGDSGDPEVTEGRSWSSLWLNAISDAIEALRSSSGVEEIALVGLRIGATLALLAAEADPAVTDIGLLAPFVRGRDYLSEERAFHALAANDLSEPDFIPPPLPQGSMESSGFLVSAEEVAALREIDLAALDPAAFASRRVLVVTPRRERRAGELAERLAAAGAIVTREVTGEIELVWDRSDKSFMPPSVSATVCAWLAGAESEFGGAPPASQPEPPRVKEISILGCREHPIVLDAAGTRLVGIVCEPGKQPRRPGDWIVFLNSGRVRRIGPNRLVANYARTWARLGVPSLRLDLGGIGDSDGDRIEDELSSSHDSWWWRNPAYLRDVEATLEWLVTEHGAKRFALVGLCSGATWSFESALHDGRIAGVALMNPAMLFSDDERAELTVSWAAAGRFALRVRSWPRLLRADGRSALVHAARRALRLGGRQPAQTHERIPQALQQLRAQGTRLAVISGSRDEGITYFKHHLGPEFQAVFESYGMSLEVIHGPDHTFRQLWSHELLRAALERHLMSIDFIDDPPAATTLDTTEDQLVDRRS